MFHKITNLPSELASGAIERAVNSFIQESRVLDVPLNKDGLFNQIIENIASIILFKTNPTGQFWIEIDDKGEVVTWALAHMAKDVDNTLCFIATDAWVRKDFRFKPEVKKWFEELRKEAKRNMCKHFIIPSSRNTKAYCRFLGGGFHKYVTLLKEDL